MISYSCLTSSGVSGIDILLLTHGNNARHFVICHFRGRIEKFMEVSQGMNCKRGKVMLSLKSKKHIVSVFLQVVQAGREFLQA